MIPFHNVRTHVLLLLWFGAPSTAFAQGAADRTAEVFKHATALRDAGDTYNAITEYHRAAFLSGLASPLASRALEDAGYAALRAGHPEDALRLFDEGLLHATPERAGSLELAVGITEQQLGRHTQAISRFANMKLGDALSLRLDEIRTRIDWSRRAEDLRDARGPRVPGAAAALALVVPGAGFAYAGEPGRALTSLLLNAAFLTGTWYAVRDENYPLAGIVGLFEIGWYFGGATGSYHSAVAFNRRQKERAFREALAGAFAYPDPPELFGP